MIPVMGCPQLDARKLKFYLHRTDLVKMSSRVRCPQTQDSLTRNDPSKGCTGPWECAVEEGKEELSVPEVRASLCSGSGCAGGCGVRPDASGSALFCYFWRMQAANCSCEIAGLGCCCLPEAQAGRAHCSEQCSNYKM